MPSYEVTSPKTGQTYSFDTDKEASQADLTHAMQAADAQHVQTEELKLRGGTGAPMSREDAKNLAMERLAAREKLWGMDHPATVETTPDTWATSMPSRVLTKILSLGTIDIPEPGTKHLIDTSKLNGPMKAFSVLNEMSKGQTAQGTGALERGIQEGLLKTGLTTPEVVNALGSKALKEGGGMEGEIANVVGSFTPGGLPWRAGALANIPKTILGKTIAGVAVGGGAAGTQEFLRQLSDEEKLDPSKIEENTAIGGVFGGVIPPSISLGAKGLSAVRGKLADRATRIAQREAKATSIEKVGDLAAESMEGKNQPHNELQTSFTPEEIEARNQKPSSATVEAPPSDETQFMPSEARDTAKAAQKSREAAKAAIEKKIEPEHVTDTIQMNDEERHVMGDLLDNAEKRANGDPSALKPEQFQAKVGEHLRQPFMKLAKIKNEIGQKLGDLVGKISKKPIEVAPGQSQSDLVINRLRNVRGLEGLAMDESGNLDFSNTTMKSAENEGARNSLQKWITQISGETPKQLHLTRQEVFEILGGKKMAQVQIQDTEEHALEAVRQGLADFLEEHVPGYRELNQQYAEIMDPLKQINKQLKYGNIEDAMAPHQDVLDEKAGTLARRLTSNYASKGEIKEALAKVSDILAKHGVENSIRPERIQDAYNIVASHYPEIVGKTTFQNLVKEGAKSALPLSPKGAILEGGKAIANKISDVVMATGEENAVKRKALRDLVKTLGEKAPPPPKTPAQLQAEARADLEGKVGKMTEEAQASRERDLRIKKQDVVKNAEYQKQAEAEAEQRRIEFEKKAQDAANAKTPEIVVEPTPKNPKGLPPGYQEIFKRSTLKDIKMQNQQKVFEKMSEAEKQKLIENAAKKMLVPKSQQTKFKKLKLSDIEEIIPDKDIVEAVRNKGK